MLKLVPSIVLIIFCIYCMITDLKSKKIYNHATFPVMIFGVLWYGIVENSYLFALKGILAGFTVLFIPFAFKGIGAGDLKFVMATGSISGWIFCIWAFLFSTIVHFLIVIVYLGKKGKVKKIINSVTISVASKSFFEKNIENAPEDEMLPYGLSFFIGVILTYAGFYLKLIS